jgi:transposase-like protein
MVAWMGLAIDATSRLWMAGVVSLHRDRALADRFLQQVRACCRFVQGLLICTDGWNAYPKSILRAFREKVKKRVGREDALERCGQTCVSPPSSSAPRRNGWWK